MDAEYAAPLRRRYLIHRRGELTAQVGHPPVQATEDPPDERGREATSDQGEAILHERLLQEVAQLPAADHARAKEALAQASEPHA